MEAEMMFEMATRAGQLAGHEAKAAVEATALNQGPRESLRRSVLHQITRGIRLITPDGGAGHGRGLPRKTTTGHDQRLLHRGHRHGHWSITEAPVGRCTQFE